VFEKRTVLDTGRHKARGQFGYYIVRNFGSYSTPSIVRVENLRILITMGQHVGRVEMTEY
jgi:hypothetical protein